MARTTRLPPRRPPGRPPDRPSERPKPFRAVDKGRAWINGAEVGGTDRRFAHLERSYD